MLGKRKEPKPVYQPVSTLKGSKLENDIVDLINIERIDVNRRTLSKDDKASRYAYKRLQQLKEVDTFDHRLFDKNVMIEQGYNTASEIIARGYPDAEKVVHAWMNSKSHRDTILGNYSCLGVREMKTEKKDTYSFVIIFGR